MLTEIKTFERHIWAHTESPPLHSTEDLTMSIHIHFVHKGLTMCTLTMPAIPRVGDIIKYDFFPAEPTTWDPVELDKGRRAHNAWEVKKITHRAVVKYPELATLFVYADVEPAL